MEREQRREVLLALFESPRQAVECLACKQEAGAQSHITARHVVERSERSTERVHTRVRRRGLKQRDPDGDFSERLNVLERLEGVSTQEGEGRKKVLAVAR